MAKSSAKSANRSSKKPASKGNASAKKQASKERGIFLSVLLGLIFLHGIFAAYLVYSSLKQGYASSTSWILPLLVLNSLAVVVSAVGMWFWKLWGIYLYVATRAVAIVIDLLLTGSPWIAVYDFIPVLILGYIISMQSKLRLFE